MGQHGQGKAWGVPSDRHGGIATGAQPHGSSTMMTLDDDSRRRHWIPGDMPVAAWRWLPKGHDLGQCRRACSVIRHQVVACMDECPSRVKLPVAVPSHRHGGGATGNQAHGSSTVMILGGAAGVLGKCRPLQGCGSRRDLGRHGRRGIGPFRDACVGCALSGETLPEVMRPHMHLDVQCPSAPPAGP
jgi:hypothetical protein